MNDINFDQIRERLIGTNIDPRSFLSTDYFNHFNEVIMMLNMLPDMPELLDDVDKWSYKTYREHFLTSELGFAPLAIEVYDYAPIELREKFDKLTVQMSMLVVETRIRLRQELENGEKENFKDMALLHSMELQGMVDDGGAIVHGYGKSVDQAAVDTMFP
jgi:hypothetical protein